MKIQAELRLYPLKNKELAPSTEPYLRALARKGISIYAGPMSPVISGESRPVFRAISKNFDEVVKEDAAY